MAEELYKKGYTQNRELAWLRFNERCLEEAGDPEVPLLERLKFLAIFSSNLDEFFAVRTGRLAGMKAIREDETDSRSGLNVDQQLKKIYRSANKLCRMREDVFRDLRKTLKQEGIQDLSLEECTKTERSWLKKYFAEKIQPVVGAQIIDGRHPMPTLQSGAVYTAALMNYRGHEVFAFVSVPAGLEKLIRLPGQAVRFIHTEELILTHMEELFKGARVTERTRFRVIRNAYVDPEESTDELNDYRERMRGMLRKRRHMSFVRLEISAGQNSRIYRLLTRSLPVDAGIGYEAKMPMDYRSFPQIASLVSPDRAAVLSWPVYVPKLSPALNYTRNLFTQIQKKDVLLAYPYESMEPFLRLLREAATDPNVQSIKLTVYRLSSKSRLVDYLCLAAENGKEVTVLIELKARFDEQNNIDYSQKLLDAGCIVSYGFEYYKVHAKICLITRRKANALEHVALISTGNFNESTARQYTDLAVLTADPVIVSDAVKFFDNMLKGVLDGRYRNLLVAPADLKPGILQLMDREIAKGEKGRILIKINGLTDEDLIMKLQEASDAGVDVQLIVRGISCLLPQNRKKTSNIHIRSIVGRWLEHSRIYVFGSGRSEKMYLSSADFMNRNMEMRVEIAVPVKDKDIRRRLQDYLQLCLADNTDAREMKSDGKYRKIKNAEERISCQETMAAITAGKEESAPQAAVHAEPAASVHRNRYSREKQKGE
ncbi:MAG: polyphosphate kinase 1 [Solobacterium sp.]|nr:polyphosphate kinase 1 [Solobacterium sp.]